MTEGIVGTVLLPLAISSFFRCLVVAHPRARLRSEAGILLEVRQAAPSLGGCLHPSCDCFYDWILRVRVAMA